jgi:hypothetical protein
MRRTLAATASVAIIAAMSVGLASVASGHSERRKHATIEGVAYLSVSGPPRRGSHTRPERGIKVTVTNTGGRLPTETRTTARDGRFLFSVAPGIYNVAARIGEPVTNRAHDCGPQKHVTVRNNGQLRLRVVCNAR